MLKRQRKLTAESIRQRYALGGRDFRGLNLQGLSFRNLDLSGADFREADLRCTDFTQAQLVGCRFEGARFGPTGLSSSLVWACCIAMVMFACNEALQVDAGYEVENVFLVPIQFLRNFLVAEAIAYVTLCGSFIFKAPRVQRKQVIGLAIAITLIGLLSIGITTYFSGLMATCVAIGLGAFFIGLWFIALLLKHSQFPGIDLLGIGILFVFVTFTSMALWSLPELSSISNAPAMAFLKLFYPSFRIGWSGFLVGYFFTAAINTLQVNLQPNRAIRTGKLATVLGTILLFLLSVWRDLEPFNAVTEFVTLSVGGAGLLAAGAIALHLSAPGNLASGRLPWLFQGKTSFQQANLVRANLSGLGQPNVNWSGADLEQADRSGTEIDLRFVRSQVTLLKPFSSWIWPAVIALNLSVWMLSLASLQLNVSSRSPLPPQQGLELLRNAASLYRVIPFGFEPVKSEDVTAERLYNGDVGKRAQAIALSPDGKVLAAGGKDEIRLWDVESGQLIQSLQGYPVLPRSIQFTEDGKYLRSLGDTEYFTKVTFWELATEQIVSQIDDVKYLVDEIAIEINEGPPSGGDQDVATWKVKQIDLRTGKTVDRFPAFQSLHERVRRWDSQVLADPNILLDFSWRIKASDHITYWDLQTGEELDVFEPGGRNQMQASPDGRYISVYRQPEPPEQVASKPTKFSILKPNLAKPKAKSSLEIWDLQTHALLQTFDAWSDLRGLIWSEDSRSLIGHNSEAFQLWNLEHGRTFNFSTLIQTPTDSVPPKFSSLIDVSHNGEVIATAPRSENAALIWKVPRTE